jgi:transcriptional regulator with XRE-family HTH domain
VESPNLKRLLARLRQFRKRHGLTQEDFAEVSGISYKYYQAIESGRKRQLRLSTLERLAAAYHIELYELFAPSMPATKVLTGRRSRAVHYERKKFPDLKVAED